MMELFTKIKNLFLDADLPQEKVSKDEFNKIIPTSTTDFDKITTEIIAASDSTYLVSAAARICVGMQPIEDYDERLKHISRVIGRGHESVLEHTNITILIHIPSNKIRYDEYSEFLSATKYLNVKTTTTSDNVLHLLISGSIRGYKHIIRTVKNAIFNAYVNEIINVLYRTAEKEFFADFIKDGIMKEDRFVYLDTMQYVPVTFVLTGNDDNAVTVKDMVHKTINVGKSVSLLATEQHHFDKIFDRVKQYDFTENDILDIATVSVIFSNVSRPISMQMIRHRNAVTQESQRYVDYSSAAFIDPMKFNQEASKNTKYKLSLFGSNFELTSQELGNRLCKIYHQLLERGMLKQDARSFLPSNVTTKFMMTFTYRNLFHFFLMRDSKAAQPEVQSIARDLKNAFTQYEPILKIPFIIADTPIYELEKQATIDKNNEIDEVIEEDEV